MLPAAPLGLSGLRVAVWASDRATHTDSETIAATFSVADELERAGAIIDGSARPDLDAQTAYQLYVQLLGAVNSGLIADSDLAEWRAQGESLAKCDVSTKALTIRSALMTHRTWIAVNEQRYRLRRVWSMFLRQFDVFVVCGVRSHGTAAHGQPATLGSRGACGQRECSLR